MSYSPVKARHLLIDDATIALVIGKMLSVFFAMQNVNDGTKQTSRHAHPMSAFGGKADIGRPSLILDLWVHALVAVVCRAAGKGDHLASSP
jgi:hypothetical protein